jgi:hypothetical protein
LKKIAAMIFALMGWFALVAQLVLMLANRIEPIGETLIRFFSYFTILTNTLVAVYFSALALSTKEDGPYKPGLLSAITLYILVVGLVYQVALRSVWDPQGLQRVVDELLHSVMPVLTLWYWARFERMAVLAWRQLPFWLIYPFVYLLYLVVRGHFSGFYPYPFMDIGELGWKSVGLNSLIMVGVFALLSVMLIGWAKWRTQQEISHK